MSDQSRTQKPLSEVERIKAASNYLRGTIQQGLADPVTGAVAEEDTQLLKFHGTYQQDDRDLRVERSRQKLEPAYAFMVRVRVPGGICTPAQWLYIDELARRYANGSLRLTTRQTFQLHGVLKRNLRETLATINAGLLDTIAACGDVNRNVMCNPNPYQSAIHKDVYAWAKRISTHLLPKTRAYHEIWLDGQPVAGGEDSEPLYGKTYLPRKFKTAIAVPPRNDVDVYAHDLGFIAIVEKGKLTGFNISVGGGLGMTHSDPATYPRLADVIGFCQPEQVLAVAEQVVAVQRDHGERSNRKHARLKYTIEDRGIDWFKRELQTRLGWPLPPPRPFHFDSTGDRLGWVKGTNGKAHFTLFIQNGRIKDSEDYLLMTALREIAAIHTGDFRLTPNQNLIIGNITSHQKPRIQALLESHRLNHNSLSGLRLNSMACVALPTCGLAMAESERYLPELVTQLETIMAEAGLQEDPIMIRMTGCPNGCARPYLAEIGLVGKTLGRYNLYLGAGFAGERLNKLYRENAAEADILEALTPLIHHYARERGKGERFGDFVIRTGYVKAVRAGREFHS